MSRRDGFTLIESIIALTILTMVAGACFQLRAQSLSQTRAIAGRQAEARLAQTILTLANAGRLGQAQAVEDVEGALMWAGQRDGLEYRLVREPVVERNPIRATLGEEEAGKFPEFVSLYRYTLDLDGEMFVMERGR